LAAAADELDAAGAEGAVINSTAEVARAEADRAFELVRRIEAERHLAGEGRRRLVDPAPERSD
jgi:hypothetical protein